ncbi:hypothetical protein J41TS12_20240 [Paenibacillus antibioticophila]|uniref:Uncharacterized protein n=1 Tax=Paenibacillus antibioticophila TaxID=1274374 RepID=A0A919XT92_9BACL|nr:hypothetical protein J41TS12_20240 [Paenibacillus antibioticophila]
MKAITIRLGKIKLTVFFNVSNERGIAMSTKRKAPAIQHKNQEQVNKKALIWTGSITAALIVVVSLIIIFL